MSKLLNLFYVIVMAATLWMLWQSRNLPDPRQPVAAPLQGVPA